MMKQYIVSYFWLVLCTYIVFKKRKLELVPFFAASGSLLTSLVLLPFCIRTENKQHKVHNWLENAFKISLSCIGINLLFGKDVVFINLKTTLHNLRKFTGEKLTWGDKGVRSFFIRT